MHGVDWYVVGATHAPLISTLLELHDMACRQNLIAMSVDISASGPSLLTHVEGRLYHVAADGC